MPSDAYSVALAGWNPGSEAEPSGVEDLAQPQDGAAAAPTVLGKLQKWADYDAVGLPVAPTMFIPMKTPMSTEILDNWSLAEEPKHPLTVPLLLAREAALGREVGMIIDLANHDCLYSDDMPDSLEYAHVQLIAKQLPCRDAINEVERAAKDFWDKHPDKYIALHCAYGFNRTGFVICSYLCQACGLTVEQALDSFAAARPPGVKHEKFIRELHARYGGGAAVTPDGSVLDGSPPVVAAVDDLAAEAERLRQWAAASEAATARGSAADGLDDGPAAQQGQQQAQCATAMNVFQQQQQQLGRGRERGPMQQQQQQRQRHERGAEHAMDDANEDVPHFEDAADMIRRESDVRRTGSLSRANTGGSADNLPAVPSALAQHPAVSKSGTPSQPGSGGSSRNPSRHGGNHFGPAQASSTEATAAAAAAAAAAGGGAAAVGGGDAAAVGAPPEGFAASRRLMQRKLSRGGGSGGSSGLSLALAASEGMHRPSGGSPDSSGSGAMGAIGGSPESGRVTANIDPTAHSSVSDFASAANYLEGPSSWRRDMSGAGSMRRSTSLGLAKALSEDFLQNNGTPSAVAPITAAAERDEGALEGQAPATSSAVAAAASQQRCGTDGSNAGSDAASSDGPSSSSSGTRDGAGGDGSAWMSSPPKPGMQPSFSGPFSSSPGPLVSSPSKRGGIPQPPGSRPQLVVCATLPAVRAGPALLSPQQQQQVVLPQQLLGQQPGTPATPASSGGAGSLPAVCGLQKQSSASGFPRSMSIDSENPSLGFNMREALAQLRLGAAGGDPAAHRGPQALADLFSQDSGFEHAALDVDEHLQALAMAQAAGLDSPAASAHLPSVIEAASSAEAGSCSPGSGSLLHYMLPPAGRAAAQQGASGQPSPAAATAAASPSVPGSPASQGAALAADASCSSGSSSPSRRARSKGRCRLM